METQEGLDDASIEHSIESFRFHYETKGLIGRVNQHLMSLLLQLLIHLYSVTNEIKICGLFFRVIFIKTCI